MSNNQIAHGHYFNKGVILKFLFIILKEHANVKGTWGPAYHLVNFCEKNEKEKKLLGEGGVPYTPWIRQCYQSVSIHSIKYDGKRIELPSVLFLPNSVNELLLLFTKIWTLPAKPLMVDIKVHEKPLELSHDLLLTTVPLTFSESV